MAKRSLWLVAFLFVVSCKRGGQPVDSDPLFDPTVGSIVALSQLTSKEKRSLCESSAMVMFVGNAEEQSVDRLPRSRDIPPRVVKPLDVHEVIKHEAAQLTGSLGFSKCGTYARKRQGDLGAALLVKVIDGAGKNDSEISTAWYGWVGKGKSWSWDVIAKDRWSYVNGALRKLKKGETFELHLPTAVSDIAHQFSKAKPPGWDAKAPKGVHPNGFDQTMYMFKTHGQRMMDESSAEHPVAASLDLATASKKQKDEWAAKAKHLFLFDPNGPGNADYTRTEPLVYSPYWLKGNACRILAGQKNLEPEAGLCRTCSVVLREIGKPLGSFERCKNFADAPNNGTLSGTNDTFGNPNDTLGNPNDTFGNPNDTFGNPNDTFGNPNDTFGNPNDTFGNPNDTFGGKDFLFLAKPTISDRATIDNPDGASILASAASYDIRENTFKGSGVSRLRLPSGRNKEAATLIVLDSCYGDARIASSIVRNETWDDNHEPRVVVVSNPAPMWVNILSYGTMNITEYEAFTQIFYWYEKYKESGVLDKHPGVKSMRDSIVLHLEKEGIMDMPPLLRAIDRGKFLKALAKLNETWKFDPAIITKIVLNHIVRKNIIDMRVFRRELSRGKGLSALERLKRDWQLDPRLVAKVVSSPGAFPDLDEEKRKELDHAYSSETYYVTGEERERLYRKKEFRQLRVTTWPMAKISR